MDCAEAPLRMHVGADGLGGRAWYLNSFMTFEDPDGNGWTVQEAPSELTER